jgi:hypothetical protein
MYKALVILLLAAFSVSAQPVYVVGGGIRAVNEPNGSGGPPLYLYGQTNADGSKTYVWTNVIASSTNAVHPVLSNLIVTVDNNVTNVSGTYGVITAGILYTPNFQILSNGLMLGTYTNMGVHWMSNHISLTRSNSFQIGTSNGPLSNVWANRLMMPNTQTTFSNPPPQSGSIQFSNGVAYSVKPDGTLADLEAQGAGGSAVYRDASHTNLTAKGLTIMDSFDQEVEALAGTTPTINATNAPVKYIELSGNTVATFSELTVGRSGLIVVSNPASHTFTFAGAGKFLNQNSDPTPTTNGYTYYWYFRPTTTITSIWVLGRELEPTNGYNIFLTTNGTQLIINSSQTNFNTATVTNNITYVSADIVASGNTTQFVADAAFAWRTVNMTAGVHITGVVNVAAANLNRPYYLRGRNHSGGALLASVDSGFRRSGTNFVSIANNQLVDWIITPDGTGGVNPTNFGVQIVPYPSP